MTVVSSMVIDFSALCVGTAPHMRAIDNAIRLTEVWIGNLDGFIISFLLIHNVNPELSAARRR